ncbi:7244_t:CDS:2 [Entrophospora sp. SA101]|nr:7244_t:CDS:2 [Entrophospora sp. SA101]CAJ0840168.1 2182_t:CDS:2 [Entrophospora sp. SA101]
MENESNSSNQLTENIEKEEDIKKTKINPEQDQEQKEPEREEPFNRNIKVYNPPSQDASYSNKINLPDSFYELSPSELKNLLSMQNSKRLASDNAGFKTRAMRQKEDEERERKYPKTLIRVKFPDSYQMQVAFLSKEPDNGPYLSEEYLIMSEDLPKPINLESDKNSSHDNKKSHSAFKWLKLGKK